jgi:TonB family protein
MKLFILIFSCFLALCFSFDLRADTMRYRMKKPVVGQHHQQRLYFEADVYVDLDALGNITFLNIYKSSGNAIWDNEALEIVKRMKHYPVRDALGKRISGWRIITVNNGGR